MNLFERMLLFPGRRLPVTDDLLPKFARVIETELKVRNRWAYEKMPRPLFLRLAQEAARRAAVRSKDGVARNYEVYLEAEKIYEATEQIFKGNVVDPAIRSLMAYNGVDVEAIITATTKASKQSEQVR